MGREASSRAVAWCALFSVCLGPFLFGSVEREVWLPLACLWTVLGLAVSLSHRSIDATTDGTGAHVAVSRALLPLHALFMLQLIPLPGSLLRMISPGSYAVYFLPDPGDGRFRPLSVHSGATIDAWIYVAGLQGLFLCLQGLPAARRRASGIVLLLACLTLAGEGLWQSRTEHPFLLYGSVPIQAPQGLLDATFGPYYNRNHFATVTAVGAGLAMGLAATFIREAGGLSRLLGQGSSAPLVILLVGSSVFLTLTSAASGSRSGTIAAVGAVALAVLRGFGKRVLLLAGGVGVIALAASGSAVIERLMRVDVLASRWLPWVDMTTLFQFFPVFGSGLGTFAVAYWPYQTNVMYEFWQHAHNEYLEMSIEVGALGLVTFALVLQRLRRSLQWRAEMREVGHGALAAFALQAVLDFPCRIPANAALLVCVLALSTRRRSG